MNANSPRRKVGYSQGCVRPTLAKGLRLEAKQGINPFRYGFVGADSHSSQPGSTEEDNWRGSLGQWDLDLKDQQIYSAYNPGGLTAVWAKQILDKRYSQPYNGAKFTRPVVPT